MIGVFFSKSFRKAFNKKIKFNKDLEKKFWEKLDLFMKDPANKSLKTHKLSGKLKDLWSFSIEYDIRIIFYYENKNAILVDIGTHDEVY